MKLDETGLKAMLDEEIYQALGYVGKLSEQRRKALYYYYGEAKEDLSPPEVDGRSSAVSTDLSDVVEWVMPALMKMFAGGDEVVQFMPRKGGDEDGAEQMTALCNYIWEKNNGFKIYHNWFKDALLEKAGVVKVWWDKRDIKKREEYRGLTDMQLTMLSQEDGIEVIENNSYPVPGAQPQPGPDGQPQVDEQGQPVLPMLHDITVLYNKPKNEICVEGVPPEEFLISRKAKDIENAPFIAHRTPKTQSDLIAAGYDPKVIDGLSTDEKWGEFNSERVERISKDDEQPWLNSPSQDRSQRIFWVAECYTRVDWDGDGVAELRKITKVGSTILDNDEIDVLPFAAITPILMPHRFFGRSLHDILAPIQRIKTAILRGALDSIYLATNPRFTALENQVNLDDLLASRPGGIVRIKVAGAVEALTSPPVHEGAFTALQYIDDWRENISGVTKYNQGTDGNSLNKTLGGINAIMQASNQRIELIGRVFAETGVKDAFRLIQKLLLQYQKESLAIRTNGKFVNVDPRVWANEYDMTVATGLGSGNKDQQVQHLMAIQQMQNMLMQSGQILPKSLMHSSEKLVEAMGFKDTENFLAIPNPQSQDPSDHPPQQQPPLPLQIEQMKQQAQSQTAQQKMQMDQQMAQVQAQADAAVEQARASADMQIQKHKIETNATLELEKARLQLQLDNEKHSREQQTALAIAKINADARIIAAEISAKQMPPGGDVANARFPGDMNA